MLGLITGVAAASSVATTRPATSITDHAATLHGLVYTGATGTAWLFEYGPTRGLGSYTRPETISSGATAVALRLHFLTPGSTYYFRLVVIQGGYMATASFGATLSLKTSRL
jgi:hypothetical protein